ncbi:MAG: MSMEG_4193 family putative phosphomutase [Marmoricola sp.]
MPILILARHGRTAANADGTLAGRTPGVGLDERGREQARAAAARLEGLPLSAAVSSPLERCRQTARLLLAGTGLRATPDSRLTECDYGDWTGEPLKTLARRKEWRTVQGQPSAARFPGGESLSAMSARAVAAVRDHDTTVARDHGPEAVWLAVSHGDIIKAVLADALGLHLDSFQRIVVGPGSLSVVRYTGQRPYVVATNTVAGSLRDLRPPRRRRRRGEDAAVGGGSGTGAGSG